MRRFSLSAPVVLTCTGTMEVVRLSISTETLLTVEDVTVPYAVRRSTESSCSPVVITRERSSTALTFSADTRERSSMGTSSFTSTVSGSSSASVASDSPRLLSVSSPVSSTGTS